MKSTIIVSLFTILALLVFAAIDSDSIFWYTVGLFFVFAFSYSMQKRFRNYRPTIVMLVTIMTFVGIFLGVNTYLKGLNSLRVGGFLHILLFVTSILAGHLIANANSNFKKYGYLLVFIFLTIPSAIFVPTIASQQTFFRTFTGDVNYSVKLHELPILDGVSLDTIKLGIPNHVIVLDFWNNTCGVCFQKFPTVAKLKKKYDGNPNVSFYAVNAFRNPNEIPSGIKLFNKYGEGLKTYFLDNNIAQKYRVEAFPTILVIKNNKVIFRGTIETLQMFDWKYLK